MSARPSPEQVLQAGVTAEDRPGRHLALAGVPLPDHWGVAREPGVRERTLLTTALPWEEHGAHPPITQAANRKGGVPPAQPPVLLCVKDPLEPPVSQV